MEGPSAATKRGAKAVSRRGPQPTVEDMRPLVSSVSNHGGGTNGTMGGGGKANLPSPPRSGQFLHQPFPTIEKDDHHKRRYRVNLPYRMLFVLTMVFLMIPLLIFFYKETHIHRAHDHFKPERFVNVKTKDVLSQFSDHAHGTAQPLDDEDSPDDEAAAAAAAAVVVDETKEDSKVVEKESEPVQEPQIPATEAKEETKKEEPRKEEEGEATTGKNEPVGVVETAEEKDKKESVDGDRNDTSDQTSEGEKVQPEAPTVVEEESKQRIRRRV